MARPAITMALLATGAPDSVNFSAMEYEKYGESFPICPEAAMEKWGSPVHWPFGTKGGING